MCCTAASDDGPRSWMSAHVADVKDADAGAYGYVFGDEPGVFDRHVPAAEVDHLRAELAMGGVQSGLTKSGDRCSAGQ